MNSEAIEVRADYERLTKYLIANEITITTMESATSGQIASLITDTPGASAILKGAFVTYCNEAKIMQGVPAETIDKYGVYSKETSKAMAEAAKKVYKANISIGITGTMGNVDKDNADSVLGNVYYTIIYDDKCYSYYDCIEKQESRLAYKFAVAKLIFESLNAVLGYVL